MSSSLGQKPTCPFCPFTAQSTDEQDVYLLLEHIEIRHPENGASPFQVVPDDAPVNDKAHCPGDEQTRPHLHNLKPPLASGSTSRSHSRESDTQSASNSDSEYILCPIHCGESVHLNEVVYHMELHDIEGCALEEFGRPDSSSNSYTQSLTLRSPSPLHLARQESVGPPRPCSDSTAHLSPENGSCNIHQKKSKDLPALGGLRGLFLNTAPKKARSNQRGVKSGVRRLGKSELGPYAYEERMPVWLHRQLERGAKVISGNEIGVDGRLVQIQRVANETAGIIPVLAQLCQQDRAISKTFLCHPSVKHIFKMSREGGFCGYRNIQMGISFLQGTEFPGHHHFPGGTPSILRLQDLIEQAWDHDFNATGRIETGGIRGTRKYIGTPEAQALFCSLEIGCEANAFNATSKLAQNRDYVHDAVLEAVLEYFSSGVVDPLQKVYQTGLAPIYFQHPGHSLTIVGLEVRKSGAMNLLVFDPMFKTSPSVVRLIGSSFKAAEPDRLLKAFRRGDAYLGKYNSFEILKLTNPLNPKGTNIDVSRTETPIRGDGPGTV